MEETKYIIAALRKVATTMEVVPDRFKATTYTLFYKSSLDGLSEKQAEALIAQKVQQTLQQEEEFDDFMSILSAKFVYAKEAMIKDKHKEVALKLLIELDKK